MSRLSTFSAVFGGLAIVLFSISWLFRTMHWPFSHEIRWIAYALAGLGALLLVIDFMLRRAREKAEREPFDPEA